MERTILDNRTTTEKTDWIKELVKAEQSMEETGLVDMSTDIDPERMLATESIQFLLGLKTEFVDASSVFNDLKPSPLGRIKIYGIAKTHADFMLFRNGFKMIFSLKAPGRVSIRFNFIGSNYIPAAGENTQAAASNLMEENLIEAKMGPFQELLWTYQGHQFRIENLVRHYMSMFIRESAR